MNHPTDDQLLLLAYEELTGSQASQVQSHVAACRACQETLAQLARGRAALDIAWPQRRRRRGIVWSTLALAAAALAGIVISTRAPSRPSTQSWTPTTTWSTTAGYVTGGKAMIDIDDQLTRLEQERYYGLPN
jgi:anti-sigma factor ChrR (cupin superfamily)